MLLITSHPVGALNSFAVIIVTILPLLDSHYVRYIRNSICVFFCIKLYAYVRKKDIIHVVYVYSSIRVGPPVN